MKRGVQAIRLAYFGKLPACADFVKVSDEPELVALLDSWLAESMNLLSVSPRWKLHYDALAPLQFAFVGTRSRRAIGGCMAASCDLSQRRYPFIGMGAVTVDAPADSFLALSSLTFAPLWQALAAPVAGVLAATATQPVLHALSATTIELDPGAAQQEIVFMEFLDRHTLAELEALLGRVAIRRTILALGLLLRPVRANSAGVLGADRSLLLPLPDPLADASNGQAARWLVAAFWLDLLAPFIAPYDVELVLLFVTLQGRPALVIGFRGAAPETLQAVIDPEWSAEHLVSFDDTEWIDTLVAVDARVHTLAAYLEQGQLSLRSARELFHETFNPPAPEGY